jgi:hypothetical protein
MSHRDKEQITESAENRKHTERRVQSTEYRVRRKQERTLTEL